jgi:predicted nucleotidyltransferase component of viral defense system
VAERLYPVSLNELQSWSAAAGVTLDEARKRFMQFVVLESLAASPIGASLAFKGGNALRFVFRNPRSTIDLDFTADAGFPDDRESIVRLIEPAIRAGASKFGVAMRVSSVAREPRGPGGTMPTWEARIAYQLPGDRHFTDFHVWRGGVLTVIDVEISLNDEVCGTSAETLESAGGPTIRTCVLEDILAEKLHSLLQQKTRRRHRKQDLNDIARMVRDHGPAIDRSNVGDYFERKSKVRDIDPRRSAFDAEIRQRASFDYETLFDEANPNHIPFDVAWSELLEFLRSLDIAD